MANAGKIMIMPKGAYDASASYEVLDLVTHKGNVWVAKRNVAGVEPSEANSADWFLMADLANYLPKSGGTIENGITALGETYSFFRIGDKGGKADIELMVNASVGEYGIYDNKSQKWIFSSKETNRTPIFNGTATGNLPLSGGTVEELGLGLVGMIGDSGFKVVKDGSIVSYLTFSVRNKRFEWWDATNGYACYQMLDTRNKPSGTYTGNGSATTRTINVGGNGKFLMVKGNDLTMYLVSNAGCYSMKDGGGNHTTMATFSESGNLNVTGSTSSVPNVSGVIYEYEVV